MKRARVSPSGGGKVHLIPRTTRHHMLGRQQAVCGVIPTTNLSARGHGSGRWVWTDDEVDCRRCIELVARGAGNTEDTSPPARMI